MFFLQFLTDVEPIISEIGWLDQIKDLFTSIGGIIGVSGVTIASAGAIILRTILPNNKLMHRLHTEVHTLQNRIKDLQTEREKEINTIKDAFVQYRKNTNEILEIVVKNSPNAKIRELTDKVKEAEIIFDKSARVATNVSEIVKGIAETIRVVKKK